MNIESVDGKFVIYRGEHRRTYFSFFVHGDSACWSRYLTNAVRYSTEEAATETIQELRERAQQRRKGKAA